MIAEREKERERGREGERLVEEGGSRKFVCCEMNEM